MPDQHTPNQEQELICALHELLKCLAGGHWSEHFRKCLAELEGSSTLDEKARVASTIRSVYGGMGSFNDWYLKPHPDFGDFDAIRTKVYDLSWIYQQSAPEF